MWNKYNLSIQSGELRKLESNKQTPNFDYWNETWVLLKEDKAKRLVLRLNILLLENKGNDFIDTQQWSILQWKACAERNGRKSNYE